MNQLHDNLLRNDADDVENKIMNVKNFTRKNMKEIENMSVKELIMHILCEIIRKEQDAKVQILDITIDLKKLVSLNNIDYKQINVSAVVKGVNVEYEMFWNKEIGQFDFSTKK